MLLILLFTFIFFLFSNALVHDLSITNDDRSLFKIETFGFIAGGIYKIFIIYLFNTFFDN